MDEIPKMSDISSVKKTEFTAILTKDMIPNLDICVGQILYFHKIL